jgi:hypothetical protein
MRGEGRRRFVALLAGAAAALRGLGSARAQAPPKVSMEEAGERRRRLGKALRELNEAAGLGVTPEDLDRAEAYATGAILEAEQKLRSLVLDDSLDVPIVFRARRRP